MRPEYTYISKYAKLEYTVLKNSQKLFIYSFIHLFSLADTHVDIVFRRLLVKYGRKTPPEIVGKFIFLNFRMLCSIMHSIV